MESLARKMETLDDISVGPIFQDEIVHDFSNFVSDLIMAGRLLTPNEDTLKDWLADNYPEHTRYCSELWVIYKL